MSNETPSNQISAKCCVSDTAFLSPPTSIYRGNSRIQTPLWIKSPFFSDISASPTRSPKILLDLESPVTSPQRTKPENKKEKNISKISLILLAIAAAFSFASFLDINNIRIATIFFVAFLFSLFLSRKN